ncbi:MAG: arylamine N-acetyltransferase [Kordiimonadaceae bacterium]|nr:arylamine N-acetyltransferase [Kordiimonadaceae bacterium]
MMGNLNSGKQTSTVLREDVYERFLDRVGYSKKPPATEDTLNAIFKVWCRDVGYDNVLKRIYFTDGSSGPLPVMDPNTFIDSWLKHGTSGSCWPSGEALVGVLELTGFNVERVAGQMLECNDPMDPNHGSMIVHLDGRRLYVDPGIASEAALELIEGQETKTANEAYGIWCKGDGHVWWRPGHSRTPIEIDIKYDGLTYEYFSERYEKTKEFSLFNTSLYIRRNRGEGILTYGRGNILRVDSKGDLTAEPIEPSDLIGFLVEQMGLSEEIVSKVPFVDEQGAEFG